MIVPRLGKARLGDVGASCSRKLDDGFRPGFRLYPVLQVQPRGLGGAADQVKVAWAGGYRSTTRRTIWVPLSR